MHKTYFISDLHFGHKFMVEHRGFNSAEEHDAHIIKMWNSQVTKRDTVYLLGDIAMNAEKAKQVQYLNGFIKVVLGNHDKSNIIKVFRPYVNSVHGVIFTKGYFLSHMPMHPDEFDHNPKVIGNIHGHIHDAYKIKDKRYHNTSVEVLNYTPVTLEEIKTWG